MASATVVFPKEVFLKLILGGNALMEKVPIFRQLPKHFLYGSNAIRRCGTGRESVTYVL